ncbi:MAG: glycine cleavage system aminomethyltransferase GcvT, partial [Elusimicrobiota bacterium]
MSTETLKRTPLFAAHQELGAKFTGFAGWDMPVFYRSVIDEHKAVRNGVGLFDVSHMGEFFVRGQDTCRFLNHLLTQEFSAPAPGTGVYTHMLNPQGGVIDDLIVYKISATECLIIVNASRIEADWAWMKSQPTGFAFELEDRSPQYGIIAVQGPRAVEVSASIAAELPTVGRFRFTRLDIAGQEVFAARTGYTGEDGFEFIAPNETLPQLWKKLYAAAGKFTPFSACGLGARDSLRLEAAYPLWGHELDETITPIETNCSWVVKLQNP